jgi:asparagine synthase (glutamine-hydrolysing)
MCGLLGWLRNEDQLDIHRFEKSLNLLTHRGPDDRGIWCENGVALGHRRLSILDLSQLGHQPMHDHNSGAVIVFNGEIYNYCELARELKFLGHNLIGNSDTEVLLHALIEWGAEALPKLNGMWAFALWSPNTNQLIVARDRFGVKPLYYYKNQNDFAFASEPKSLLSLFPQLRAINENNLLDFLGNNLLYANHESFYKDINIIPPAHYAVYNKFDRSFKISRYWEYPRTVNFDLSEDEALDQFTHLFTDSVRLRMRSDVPVGVTLSGGLDSTAVLAASAKFKSNKITCFTSVYSDNNQGEKHWAQLACSASNSTLTPVVAPEYDWINILRKVAWHMDGPGYSPAVIPLWHLMQRARDEGIFVLLEGQGADEALAGYPQYAVINFLEKIRRTEAVWTSFPALINEFLGLSQTFSLRWTLSWLGREISPALLNLHRQHVGFRAFMLPNINIPTVLNNQDVLSNSVQRRLLKDHSVDILPGLLHYGDSISMAHGIESRNPFLDYRLVEWMFKLPANLLFNHNTTKWVLREYLRKEGQVDIGNRPDKKGYPTPVREWLSGPKGNEVESILLANDSPILQWCDPIKIKKLIQQNRQGVISADHHLFKLLSTQLWIQECLSPHNQ